MPQLLRVGPYIIYFWSNENNPLEPIHVHIAEGKASSNATKVWISSKGRTVLCNNNSMIPNRILKKIMKIIEANNETIIEAWVEHFGEIRYYC